MSKTKRTKKSVKKMSMLEVVARWNRREDADHVAKDDVEEFVRKMVMCRCGWGGVVVEHGQRGPGVDRGSATMLNSEGSEECSGWVDL